LHVNFESQSLGANFQALHMVMTPKRFLKKLVPELDYEYPWGVPEHFYFDRGADYDNDSIRHVGVALDVGIEYAKGDDPDSKGEIERFWRTLKEDVVHGVPGAVLRDGRVVAGVDQDEPSEEARAWMYYSEFVRHLWRWVAMDYAKRPHRGIGDIPLARYQESAARIMPRAPRKTDDLVILLKRVEGCTLTRLGVTWQGLTWVGKALEAILSHPSARDGMQVDIRFDEYDVSQAWVTDPVTRRFEKLEPKMKTYMTGLSLHAHDRIQKNNPKLKEGTYDERALMQTRKKMRGQEAAVFARAARTKNGVVPTQVAKYAGIGQQAPHDDDLGSVLPDPLIADDAFTDGIGDAADEQVQPDEPDAPASPGRRPARPRVAARRLRNVDE
jgi:hypothetical protein